MVNNIVSLYFADNSMQPSILCCSVTITTSSGDDASNSTDDIFLGTAPLTSMPSRNSFSSSFPVCYYSPWKTFTGLQNTFFLFFLAGQNTFFPSLSSFFLAATFFRRPKNNNVFCLQNGFLRSLFCLYAAKSRGPNF